MDVGWIEHDFPAVLHECKDFDDDYVGQQVTKLHANKLTDAAFVLFVDSDHRFIGRCNLRRQLFDPAGRLRCVIGRSGERPTRDGWHQCAPLFFRRRFNHNLAGPLPLAVPSMVFSGLQADAQRIHGTSLEDYALALQGDRLCEAALFAGWLYLNAKQDVSFLEDDGTGLLSVCMTPWSRCARFNRTDLA